MQLTRKYKILLAFLSLATLSALLFPPWVKVTVEELTLARKYAFLFTPPRGETIQFMPDWKVLLIELFAIAALGIFFWVLLAKSEKD